MSSLSLASDIFIYTFDTYRICFRHILHDSSSLKTLDSSSPERDFFTHGATSHYLSHADKGPFLATMHCHSHTFCFCRLLGILARRSQAPWVHNLL